MIPASQRLPRRYRNPVLPEPVRTWVETRTYEVPGGTLPLRLAYRDFRGQLRGDERRAWPAARFKEATKDLPRGLWGNELCLANIELFPPRRFVRDDLAPLIVENGHLRRTRRQLREAIA
jgi:hypothetical protein